MTLELPIYVIVGQRPLKFTLNDDGSGQFMVWDFDANEFVGGGPEEYDVLMGHEAPGGQEDALRGDVPFQGGLDHRYVGEVEFEEYVEELRKAAKASSEAPPRNIQGD